MVEKRGVGDLISGPRWGKKVGGVGVCNRDDPPTKQLCNAKRESRSEHEKTGSGREKGKTKACV